MDTQIIKLFMKIADGETFFNVAEDEHISPSSLSRAIKKLESELEVELFDRSGRSVVLTDAGRIFRNQIESPVREIEDIRQNIRAYQAKDIIQLGIMIHLTNWNLYRHLSDFSDLNKSVEINQIMPESKEVALRSLRQGDLDLLIAHLPLDSTFYEYTILHSDPLCVAISEASPLIQKKEIYPTDLYGFKLILLKNCVEEMSAVSFVPALAPLRDHLEEVAQKRPNALLKVAYGDRISIFHQSSIFNSNNTNVAYRKISGLPSCDLAIATSKIAPHLSPSKKRAIGELVWYLKRNIFSE